MECQKENPSVAENNRVAEPKAAGPAAGTEGGCRNCNKEFRRMLNMCGDMLGIVRMELASMERKKAERKSRKEARRLLKMKQKAEDVSCSSEYDEEFYRRILRPRSAKPNYNPNSLRCAAVRSRTEKSRRPEPQHEVACSRTSGRHPQDATQMNNQEGDAEKENRPASDAPRIPLTRNPSSEKNFVEHRRA